MLARRFKKYDNFLFDLDGTVWKWTKLIPGAIRLFQALKRENKNIYFFTNNVILTRESFARKLSNFGINATETQILNPSLPAIDLLQGNKVFVIGEGIITDLKKARIKIVSSNADAVFVSTDRHVDYNKLEKASDFVRNGAEFYTNAKGGKWVYGDKIRVGAGALTKAIEEASDKEAIVIGKPSYHMAKKIQELGLDKSKTLIIGDEMTDIIIGNRLKFDTALVLTGIATKKDYNDSKGLNIPKYLLNSISDIIS
ncbi:MAG: HAD-IIA family hydrolase [Candidatus Aenigmarchaeota archaeon]|nr:HAD-IIA family hydrolase [Candidatus Aenigmarchaeota archaeon]